MNLRPIYARGGLADLPLLAFLENKTKPIGCGHGVLSGVAFLPLAGSTLLGSGAAVPPDRVEVSDEEAAEEGPARPKPKRKPAAANGEAARPKKARREKADGAPAKPNGFTREHHVTPELAAWLDRASISRPELTKFFWAYVKERGLQARSPFLRGVCSPCIDDLRMLPCLGGAACRRKMSLLSCGDPSAGSMSWQGVLQTRFWRQLCCAWACLGVWGSRAQQASRQGVLAEEVMLYGICLLCWRGLGMPWPWSGDHRTPQGKVGMVSYALFVLTVGGSSFAMCFRPHSPSQKREKLAEGWH